MFTGIVEEIGTVELVKPANNLTLISIKAKKIFPRTKLGDSVAVDGVCLTVVKKIMATLFFEAMKETLDTTTVGSFKKGQNVNLERALSAKSRFDGHFVTGHADGLGRILKVFKKENYVAISIRASKKLMKFIVLKGSICINGVSLTVGKVGSEEFEVYLIPYTLKETNLGLLKSGDQVNIEVDILARYVLNNLKK